MKPLFKLGVVMIFLPQGPGASECTKCEAGHYCDSRTTSKAEMIGSKICPAGTHCPPGTVEKPDLHDNTYACWKGHYCLRGDEVMFQFNIFIPICNQKIRIY